MTSRLRIVVLVSLLLFTFGSVYAQGTALSLKASTMGFGFDVTRSIITKLNGRVGMSLMSFGYSGETNAAEPVAYDLDLKMFACSALADFYPLGSGIRLSGGFVYNGMKIEGTGMAVEDYEFDSKVFAVEDMGSFSIKAEPSTKLAPYLGIGFGNPVAANKKIGVNLDIGLLYMGAPDVTLEADEGAMIYPTTTQEADVEEDIKSLKWYPVINLGVSYKF